MIETKWPCGGGMWTLCPETHPDIVLAPPKDVWSKLAPEQKNFWFIDEVEARWQQLLYGYPMLSHLTVHHCNSEQLLLAWDAIADFIGNGAISRKSCKYHTHQDKTIDYQISDELLDQLDNRYVLLMNYTEVDLLLIRVV